MNNPDLLKRLCLENGISGDEARVRELVLNEIKPYVTSYKIDNLGNLIVFKEGKARPENKLMISAHMDEVGLIVTHITSEGLVKFDEVGGIDRRVLSGKRVLINNRIPGVIGVKPIHLCSSDERGKTPAYSDMYIDIGADSKEEALSFVKPGDSVCFDSFYDDSGDYIRSKAIDDRVGVYLMIEMIRSELEYDTRFTFVVQEEVGLHGAKTAAFAVDPDFSIVLEATTAADIPGISDDKQVCNVGKGAVVGFMDRHTIYDKELISSAQRIADANNIKMQFKRAVAGGNDAGVIHCSREGVRTLAVSLPCRYLHSQLSLIAKSDIDDVYKLSKLLAEEISGGKI